MNQKAHLLGDVTAEVDHPMLDRAFLETADYSTIISSTESPLIVGRRGTGKSAIFYQLQKVWGGDKSFKVVIVSPEDYEMITLYHFVELFGDRFSLLKAASKIFFRYLSVMEVAMELSKHYRFDSISGLDVLHIHLRNWRKLGNSPILRLKKKLDESLDSEIDPRLMVSELVANLQIDSLENDLATSINKTRLTCRLLYDRLDEGYEASEVSTALMTGLSMAVTNLNASIPGLRCFMFLRDNIARAIAETDPDYTRNLESRILRLHWDEQTLFYMICKRLRVAYNSNVEKDLEVWNSATSQDLRGRKGFRSCLRLTLYRPRDLIVLLNSAFYSAYKNKRVKIDNSDIESAAHEISNNRKRDLLQEYSDIIVGLELFLSQFAGGNRNLSYLETRELILKCKTSQSATPKVLQHLEILGVDGVIQSLYSIGFIGIKSGKGNSFIFSHDGKSAEVDLGDDTDMIIHPCYWMALGLSDHMFDDPKLAGEIYDDLDIEVTAESTDQRNKKIGQYIAKLGQIKEGTEGASEFEDWCESVVRIIFAGGIDNVELNPNKNSTQRRDVVATNIEGTTFWKRVKSDYQTRQVMFEVKNVARDLKSSEFRQALSYLTGPYGKVCFIITRSEKLDLVKGKELDWIQEMYFNHGVLIIKLTGKFLSTLLSKQRNTEKFPLIDRKMTGLLDRYLRVHLSLGKR